jgi:hypothetical protein
LTLAEQYTLASRRECKQKGQHTKNGLPDLVELALGMRVMVTTNVDTDLNVANGTCREIIGIKLDP